MSGARPAGLVGLNRAEIDRIEERDITPNKALLRPVDAATLILLDWRGGVPHVLIGRRHHKHAFMPGKFVFPGGRTDPTDARVQTADELHEAERIRLMGGPGRTASAARTRAIALSAIRETFEEAGLLIGKPGPFRSTNPAWQEFANQQVVPALSGLRFIARAVTPPGRVRRFDTRFFAAAASGIAVSLPGGGPSQELEELVWLPVAEAMAADVPGITRQILEELKLRLQIDPALAPASAPVPSFRFLHNRFRRDLIGTQPAESNDKSE